MTPIAAPLGGESYSFQTMPTRPQTLQTPSTVRIGAGCRHQAGEMAGSLGAGRVLLVTDPGVIDLSLHEDVLRSLEQAGCQTLVYDGVQPDPTDANVRSGVEAARRHRPEVIVAIGGGSAMDCAKAMAVAVRQGDDFPSWMGIDKIPGAGLPLIAIPTTAGTGSEVTKVAVITDTAREVKMMMLSSCLLPAVALVDYELSLGMPRSLTAAVGVDTLTHGIEAFVSKKAGGLTDPIALSCISLCGRYLRRAWQDGTDREARAAMMLAATQGGIAFTNSSVALVHGMSRPIGAVFHIPHGLSNAVLLPAVTAWSLPGSPDRYAEVARTLGAAERGDDDPTAGIKLVGWLQALNDDLEIPRLGKLLAGRRDPFEAHRSKMASDALASGSPGNNPRVPDAAEIESLYENAWK